MLAPDNRTVMLLIEILRSYPSVRGLLFDRPTVVERAQSRLEAAGLLERVLPEKIGPEALDDLLADLDMLANPGGQERSVVEYRLLLWRAGFTLERIIETSTPFKILESVPA